MASYCLEGGGEQPDWCSGADLDFSGVVDWAGVKIFCDYWLTGAGQ